MGLVSHNIVNLLLEKVNKMLNLPSIQTACTTNQAEPNDIAAKDAMNGFGLLKKHGFHQMRHTFGFLKELISFSIDKLERHAALCRDATPNDAPDYILEPFDDEGFDVISRNSSTANYMRDDHTLKNIGKSFIL